jgi:hypothetical protein
MSAIRLIACAIAAVVMCACGDNAETPTSATSTTAEPITILFSGTLQPLGTRFYSYTMTSAGTVSAMLASLERGSTPMSNSLELGLGIPAGTGCATSVASNTNTSLIPQLRQDFDKGTYCVRISDKDGLPAAMTFTIRLVHP